MDNGARYRLMAHRDGATCHDGANGASVADHVGMNWRGRARLALVLPMLALALASCSWTDDKLTGLRDRITGWFDDEDTARAEESANGGDGTNLYPSLSDIPDRPNLSVDERREAIRKRLEDKELTADTSGTNLSSTDGAGPGSPVLAPALQNVTPSKEIEPLFVDGNSQKAASSSYSPAVSPSPPVSRLPVAKPSSGEDPYRVIAQAPVPSNPDINTPIGSSWRPIVAPSLGERGGVPARMQSRVLPLGQIARSGELPSSVPIPIGSVFFGLGSAVLSTDDRGVIRQIAAVQRQRGGKVLIVAHSSRRSRLSSQLKARLSNFDLSVQRAQSIQAALVRQGVRRSKIGILAQGDGVPKQDESSADGEAGNRRADLFLIL